MSEIQATIQFRQGVDVLWAISNPTLLSGEIGIELNSYIDSGGIRYYKAKMGPGVWNSLPYIQVGTPGGGGAWGDITGTVTDQGDLVAYIAAQIAALVDSSPGALDTLNELAAALGDDPNFSTTIATALAGKVDGPASSVNNRIALFDGVTGKLLKDTGKVVYTDSTFNTPTDNDLATALAIKTYVGKGPGNIITDLCIYGDGGTVWTYTNQVSTPVRWTNTDRHAVKFDTRNVKQLRLVAQVISLSASVNSPNIYMEYSLDGTSWTKIGDGSVNQIISLSSAGKKATEWITIPAGLVDQDAWFAIGCTGGDGVADPSIMSVHIQMRNL